MSKLHEKIGKWLIKVGVALIVVLIAVQIGIYQGRKMERTDRLKSQLPQINALIRSDGYCGRLSQRDGRLRIVYSLADLKAIGPSAPRNLRIQPSSMAAMR